MVGRLGYNNELDRYGILYGDLWEREGLHCGEVIEIEFNNQWIRDRVEYNHKIKQWYLVDSALVGEELEYIRVKF